MGIPANAVEGSELVPTAEETTIGEIVLIRIRTSHARLVPRLIGLSGIMLMTRCVLYTGGLLRTA